jgi:hypothetical protein
MKDMKGRTKEHEADRSPRRLYAVASFMGLQAPLPARHEEAAASREAVA